MGEPSTSEGEILIPRILIVAGPTSTGKTTVARALAERYGVPFVEGDDLHPAANIEKMSSGQPLTDEDRWEWLKKLCQTVLSSARPPESSLCDLKAPVCIASCSALKRVYRDYIRQELRAMHISKSSEVYLEESKVPSSASGSKDAAVLYFVYLTASEEELMKRIKQRKGHYMKSDMVQSQLESTEVPHDPHESDGSASEENEDCMVITTDNLNPEEVVHCAVAAVDEVMTEKDKLRSYVTESVLTSREPVARHRIISDQVVVS